MSSSSIMRYDETSTRRDGPQGPTGVTYNVMVEEAISNHELMVLATNNREGSQLNFFPKARNAYLPAIPVPRELADGTLRLVCFVGPREVVSFTEARIIILRIDRSLDQVQFDIQFDLSGEPQQHLLSCTTLPDGGYRAVIGKRSIKLAVYDVHNGVAMQCGTDFQMLPNSMFRPLGWYDGMPLFVLLTAGQRKLYRYDVRADKLAGYDNFQTIGQTMFKFELVGNCVLEFDLCGDVGGVQVYDLPTQQWKRHYFELRNGGKAFTRVKSLRNGEVLARMLEPPKTLLSTFFDQPPRLSELALRVVLQKMPERTAHALHESTVRSVADLLAFLKSRAH